MTTNESRFCPECRFVILILLVGGLGGYMFKDYLVQPAAANDGPLTTPEATTPHEIPLIDPADLPVLPAPDEVSREVAGMGDHPDYVAPDEPIEYDGGEEPVDVAGMGEHPDYLMPDEPIVYDDGSTGIFGNNHAKDEAKSLQDYIDAGNRYARDKNYAMAVAEIEQAANMGHADSQRFMGEMYRDGKGVSQDYSKAHEWYEIAASNNSADAMYALALFYWEGNGVTKDIQKARSLFLQAANLGDAEAQYNLGMIYKMGWGVEKDHYESFRWVEMAANQDLAEALYVVGYDYEHGEGVEKDMDRALAYYRKAAELGEARAIKKMKSH